MSAVAIVAATVISYVLGWAGGIPVLVPVLNTLAGVPFMVVALRRGAFELAIVRMLLWALTMGVAATALSYVMPAQTDVLFLRGEAYRAEMFAWVMTGTGAENTPSLFVPQQAQHALIFSGLALATGGVVAMAMGAVLMNYMGHYVGALGASSARPLLTMLLAWSPWSVIRVISFVAIGVILSVPVLSRIAGVRVDWPAARPLLLAAYGGLVIDVVLKAALAPAWGRLLLHVVGW